MSAALHSGALVEIDLPGTGAGRTVTRRIATWRQRNGGDYACLLSDPEGGGLVSAILAQTDAGRWLCVSPPVAMQPPPPDARRGRL